MEDFSHQMTLFIQLFVRERGSDGENYFSVHNVRKTENGLASYQEGESNGRVISRLRSYDIGKGVKGLTRQTDRQEERERQRERGREKVKRE